MPLVINSLGGGHTHTHIQCKRKLGSQARGRPQAGHAPGLKMFLAFIKSTYVRTYILCYTGDQTEYKLFTDYYNKLVDILPASDLSHYFVSDKVISLTDHERIIRTSVPQDSAQVLLDRVSLQLKNGNIAVFTKMLIIMEHYGTAAAKALSMEIKSKLPSIKYQSITVSSSDEGTYNNQVIIVNISVFLFIYM